MFLPRLQRVKAVSPLAALGLTQWPRAPSKYGTPIISNIAASEKEVGVLYSFAIRARHAFIPFIRCSRNNGAPIPLIDGDHEQGLVPGQ